ncbi:MAG: hypothetical protein ACFWT6_13300 [Virgibacillus proomii]|jgi:hypothetical protein
MNHLPKHIKDGTDFALVGALLGHMEVNCKDIGKEALMVIE